ncbi:hypothetical protein [Streptoalloteichus tenebrarius]|uniref:hypothetical protein n=1 Tax=Streptoalloteichus tenebrarius (strain ATCC 17920 / DSM 40477 / JCM 4838 / CBS 697.72 / NBRC 16177 / NCIMB 11028 / NRRL B-12390 / A12253. 1 / ISP 5477) TaxID=1933 RepID=UPI0020A2EC10|nr:hypothetical protein [Streptoalloteichus tenebrarius]
MADQRLPFATPEILAVEEQGREQRTVSVERWLGGEPLLGLVKAGEATVSAGMDGGRRGGDGTPSHRG